MARYLIGRGVPEDHVVRRTNPARRGEPDVQPGDHGAVPARLTGAIIVTSNSMCSGPHRRPPPRGQRPGDGGADRGYYWRARCSGNSPPYSSATRRQLRHLRADRRACPWPLRRHGDEEKVVHGLSRAGETPAGAGRLHRSEKLSYGRHPGARDQPPDLDEDVAEFNASLDIIRAPAAEAGPTGPALRLQLRRPGLARMRIPRRRLVHLRGLRRQRAVTSDAATCTPLGGRTPLTADLLRYDVTSAWWVTPTAYQQGIPRALPCAAALDQHRVPFPGRYYSNTEIPPQANTWCRIG